MLNSISNFLKIPNTNEYEQRTYFVISLLVASVAYYDLLVVKIPPTPSYFLTRLAFILLPYLYAHFFKNSKFGQFNNEFFMFNYFNYSFFYSYFYDYAYIIAFAQFALGMAGLITISRRLYNYLIFYGVVLTYTAIYSSPKFDNHPSNYDIQAVYANSMFYVFLVSYFVYHRSIKVREEAQQQELVFADIGKKLSVVLHELQGSLRNISNTAFAPDTSKDLQDIQEISRLINVLTSSSQPTHKTEFKASKLIDETLEQHFAYTEHYNIQVSSNLLHDDIDNDPLAFKIIVKNIIKNAIEATVELPEQQRKIDLFMQDSADDNKLNLIIQNSFAGNIKNINEIKKPFVTTKKNITNRGLGLYIIDILAKSADIELCIKAEANTFSVSLRLPKTVSKMPVNEVLTGIATDSQT